MLCIEIVEHGNVTIVPIDFTNQIWLKISLEPDRSNRSTKIETRKLRTTDKFSCERGIKNKVVNKICVLLKNSYNFESIMCLVIESVIIDIAGTFLSQLSLSYISTSIYLYHRHLYLPCHCWFDLSFDVPRYLTSC